MSRSKWRLFFWRWHRRLGIAVALFILLVCSTGLVLNHSHELGLLQQPLRQAWLLASYGIEIPRVSSYQLGEKWVAHLGGHYLYLDGKELAYCANQLSGAVAHEGMWVIACSNELLLLTPQGEVVERIGAAYGVPRPIDKIGLCGSKVCLQSGDKRYLADIEQLSWRLMASDLNSVDIETNPPSSSNGLFEASQPSPLPASIKTRLLDQYLGEAITWERVLLDIHSGRLLPLGPWLMDLVAILFMVLALSGVTMWYSGLKRARRHY